MNFTSSGGIFGGGSMSQTLTDSLIAAIDLALPMDVDLDTKQLWRVVDAVMAVYAKRDPDAHREPQQAGPVTIVEGGWYTATDTEMHYRATTVDESRVYYVSDFGGEYDCSIDDFRARFVRYQRPASPATASCATPGALAPNPGADSAGNAFEKPYGGRWNGNNAAFPIPQEAVYDGITKREYYAGLAMQGLMSNPSTDGYTVFEKVAQIAVMQSDALLAELAK